MADNNPAIDIEVVHATPERQRIVKLAVPAGTTARSAAMQSGLDQVFAGLDLAQVPLGVFGERVPDGHELQRGDRVELYRPLVADPRAARRAAASAGRALGKSG